MALKIAVQMFTLRVVSMRMTVWNSCNFLWCNRWQLAAWFVTLRVASMETMIMIWLQMSCNFLLLSHFRWESLSKGVQKKGSKSLCFFTKISFDGFNADLPLPQFVKRTNFFNFFLDSLPYNLPFLWRYPPLQQRNTRQQEHFDSLHRESTEKNSTYLLNI